jgi:hypothetical protein
VGEVRGSVGSKCVEKLVEKLVEVQLFWCDWDLGRSDAGKREGEGVAVVVRNFQALGWSS